MTQSSGRPLSVLFSCEHAGNHVPARYRRLFQSAAAEAALTSHRGWDPGALELASSLANAAGGSLFSTRVTRLLVETNRSLHHRRLFSEFVSELDIAEREQLINTFYLPYRDRVEEEIRNRILGGNDVLHLSIHSFTPQWNGEMRAADVGLLYDPQRGWEKALCARWREVILKRRPDLLVRRNFPYLGCADGFTTYLRKQFPANRYAGIEVEVNQRWAMGPKSDWRSFVADFVEAASTWLTAERTISRVPAFSHQD